MNKNFEGLDLGLVDGDLANAIQKGLRKGCELSIKIEPITPESDILESRIEGNGTFMANAYGIAQLIKAAAGSKNLHEKGAPVFKKQQEFEEALIVMVAALVGVNVEVVKPESMTKSKEDLEDMSKYKEI